MQLIQNSKGNWIDLLALSIIAAIVGAFAFVTVIDAKANTPELRIDLSVESQAYNLFAMAIENGKVPPERIRPLTDETRPAATAYCSQYGAVPIGDHFTDIGWAPFCYPKTTQLPISSLVVMCDAFNMMFTRFEYPSTVVCRDKTYEEVGAKQKT